MSTKYFFESVVLDRKGYERLVDIIHNNKNLPKRVCVEAKEPTDEELDLILEQAHGIKRSITKDVD